MIWDFQTAFYTFLVIVFVALCLKTLKQPRRYSIRTRDVTKGHCWCSRTTTGFFSQDQTCYCNVCESLLLTTEGLWCDSCGICADGGCMRKADQQLPCKPITSVDEVMKHHWVKGNVPVNSSCIFCHEDCGMETGLVDLYCSWCQRTIHTECRESLDWDMEMVDLVHRCDFGNHAIFVVPPTCVRLKRTRRLKRPMVITHVEEARTAYWAPLIVIGNRKSGNNDGATILSAFRRVLNPAQVIDLAERSPEEALQWCQLLPTVKWQVLVAGGDGTIGWLLNAMDNLNLDIRPPVCIVPLGTGNDLSRTLGWGSAHVGQFNTEPILDQILHAKEVSLDRWCLRVTPARHLGISLPVKDLYMNNYVSIGVDALVTLNFHKARESPYYPFNSRILNKFLYLSFGTKDILERECKNLGQKLQLYLDEVQVELPDIEAVVILNIPNWGAGVIPWTLGKNRMSIPQQSYNDGKLEVFCVYSSFHIAQMQVGLSEPYRVGQASTVKIVLLASAPMQVDGEPWEQHPGTIEVSFHNKVNVLVNRESVM